MPEGVLGDPMMDFPEDVEPRSPKPGFYKRRTGNMSTESLDSDALLDHRYV